MLDLSLYVVTDRALAGARGVAATIGEALTGGATVIQLRDKDAGTAAMVREARALRALCAACAVPLIVNDRVDVALAAGAEGVHLGQDDLPVREARRLLGPRAIVGVSVRRPEEARAALEDGATYVAANGVWETATKTDFGAALGLEGLARITRQSPLPVVAIGGVHAGNARALRDAGCAGIAVVSAVMRAEDPASVCRALRAAFG